MVVLSAAVCTKSGKALLARQFVEMPRTRVEGLLAAFPKLVGLGQQHTFVETDSVRYVYQPLEELFVVLITTKTSNILEDLQTLHLFTRLIPEYCRVPDEEEVQAHAYELIFAFDELVTLGYNDNLPIPQVRTFTEMDSHEERIQEMIARNKEIEAKEQAKLRIKQMDVQRKEAARRTKLGGGPVPGSTSGGFGGNQSSGGFGGSGGGIDRKPSGYTVPQAESPREDASRAAAGRTAGPAPGRGLQLSVKKPRADEFLEAMKSEDGLEVALEKTSLGPAASTAASPGQPATEPVHLILEEKVVMVANRDGGVENLEVKGDLLLRIAEADRGLIRVRLGNVNNKQFQFKTHPNVDRNLFMSDNVIGLKDASRPFPIGQPLGVVRWRFQSKEEDDVPLYVNCWPQLAAGGVCEVAISYQLTRESLVLQDVVISLPLPSGAGNPVIKEPSVGDCEYNKQKRMIEWRVPVISADEAKSGEIELEVKNADPAAFFPVRVAFTSQTLYSGLTVDDVVTVQGGQHVAFSQQTSFLPEDYSVA